MEQQHQREVGEGEEEQILIRNIIICFVGYTSCMCLRPVRGKKSVALYSAACMYCWLAAAGHQRTSDSKLKTEEKKNEIFAAKMFTNATALIFVRPPRNEWTEM